VFTETYQTDLTKGGAGAGIFANVQALGEYANEALSQTINKLLSDGKFLKELKNQPQASGASGTPNERLLQLESLKNEGLITESEYSEKRRKILQEL
jgi:hypothetical protein